MIQFVNSGTHEEEKLVMKYNQHFFGRHNERMGLGLTDTSKVITHKKTGMYFIKYFSYSCLFLPGEIAYLHHKINTIYHTN